MSEHERPLTPLEEEFVDAAVRQTSGRWSGECDAERMAALVERDSSLLETIGPAVLNIAAYRRGCAPAPGVPPRPGPGFLGGRAVRVRHRPRGRLGVSTDNLRILLERGMADARSTSNPHTGWPDNVSLLYWPAALHNVGGRDGEPLTRLLLEHGADPEVKFKGNGERGCTALQEACVYGRSNRDGIARALIDHGAHDDPFSAAPGTTSTDCASARAKIPTWRGPWERPT